MAVRMIDRVDDYQVVFVIWSVFWFLVGVLAREAVMLVGRLVRRGRRR